MNYIDFYMTRCRLWLPFLITAVVLVLSSIRNRRNSNMPEALGNNYFREER